MKRKFGFVAAWLGATIVSLTIASAAVTGIRTGVEDSPIASGAPTTFASTFDATSSTTTPSIATTTTSEATTTTSTSTTSTSVVTTTTVPSVTSTTVLDGQTPPPTTTTAPPPPTTTTTTTTTVASQPRDYELIGGWVRVRIGSDTVDLISATPKPGFAAKVKEDGPDKVKVTFTSNTHKSEFKAEFDDSEYEFDIEEEPIGDDDDD